MQGTFLQMKDASRGARVVVAMSGGVDSSLAAALLVENGFRVVGVTTKNFCYGEREGGEKSCCSVEAVEEARRICHRLDISHTVINVEEEFDREVVEHFISEYRRSRTPNPCIRCNECVRFRALSALAERMGASYIATGHYARIFFAEGGGFYLARGLDRRKDQSYFLSHFHGLMLGRVLLPLGEMSKEKVRAEARRRELPVAEKPDSQEVCFLPEGGLDAFLRERIPLEPGPVVDTAGRVLGQHRGLQRYTIGQRKGIGISSAHPLYVLRLEAETNTLVVGTADELEAWGMVCSLVWLDGAEDGRPGLEVQVRSRHHPVQVDVWDREDRFCRVRFRKPQRAVCPGQTAAFYRDGVVVGAGIIERAL